MHRPSRNPFGARFAGQHGRASFSGLCFRSREKAFPAFAILLGSSAPDAASGSDPLAVAWSARGWSHNRLGDPTGENANPGYSTC